MQRVKELKQAEEAQLHQLERLTDLHGAVQQSQTGLVGRLDRAAKLHSNLHSRCEAPPATPTNERPFFIEHLL